MKNTMSYRELTYFRRYWKNLENNEEKLTNHIKTVEETIEKKEKDIERLKQRFAILNTVLYEIQNNKNHTPNLG